MFASFSDPWLLVAIGTAAIGMYGMLPPRGASARCGGAILLMIAFSIFSALVCDWNDWKLTTTESVFWILATCTLVPAVATVTSRNPVYSALWFGLTLLGTAALFMFIGAQFLAVATIVVYAGAILVTFLFVLMLATPSGNAPYDRLSWEGLLSACAAAMLAGVLTTVLVKANVTLAQVEPRATATDRTRTIEAPQHMAHLGRELFSTHLIAVEAAGTLLLVALIGAVAIVAHGRTRDKLSPGSLPAENLPGPRLQPQK